MQLFFKTILVFVSSAISIAGFTSESLSADDYELRRVARERKRRLVFHSDGVSMNPEKQYLEANASVLPHLPGTQTDACTYSLIHQFPVTRLYRTTVGIEHPPGIIEKLYGNGPDGLQQYIEYCRENGFEAFWAMRTNDTHDATNDEHGQRRLQSNSWKLENFQLLVGDRNSRPPFAGWTAYDYAESEVRDKVFEVLKEVSTNYEVDGIVLDFFRHLPTFKSTAWGGVATQDECEKLTSLLRRTRGMLDKVGADRGRPILLSVRTPDGLDYCRALGIDVEQWMKEGLIDIWIATGYFRLQDWEKTVEIGHKYDVQVWASMDESRVVGRDNRNSLEVYRARIMNAWRAGVDAVWMFNFFYYPDDPQFRLLFEAGSINTLALKNKTYVADGRGKYFAKLFLKDGESYISRPTYFSPRYPEALGKGETNIVNIQVGDDIQGAIENGYTPLVLLKLQTETQAADNCDVSINGNRLKQWQSEENWTVFFVDPALIECGSNQISIAGQSDLRDEINLRDLQLTINYKQD